jgi:hypothetical protein
VAPMCQTTPATISVSGLFASAICRRFVAGNAESDCRSSENCPFRKSKATVPNRPTGCSDIAPNLAA